MPLPHRALRSAVLATCLFTVASTCLPAAEIVTLSNGFSMRCNHHAQVGRRVRIYLGKGQDSYIELRPQEIEAIHTAPDIAPLEPPEQQPAVSANACAKLTPADLHQILSSAGVQHNVNVDLLASVVKAESGGNPHAVSRAGAKGLMQLMPQTASDLGVADSFRPGDNVRGGATYLDALLTRYHDNLALALAAYNAGPAAVDKYHGIPPYRETRVYVARVIHEFNRRVRLREDQAANTSSSRGSGK